MRTSNFKKYRFEELEVWSIGMEIVHEVYCVIKKLPADEKFSLADQLRRASISVVLNIAEGSGQPTTKGFALYIHRAKSSVLECVACVKIALQESLIVLGDTEQLNTLLEKEYFKLIALEKSLKK